MRRRGCCLGVDHADAIPLRHHPGGEHRDAEHLAEAQEQKAWSPHREVRQASRERPDRGSEPA